MRVSVISRAPTLGPSGGTATYDPFLGFILALECSDVLRLRHTRQRARTSHLSSALCMVLKTMWSDFTMLPNMRRIDRARHPLPYSKEPTTCSRACLTCPQSAKRRKDTQTNRCDYDDSDAMRGAGHVARPNHRKPLVRANPNDNAQRLSLALLPSDDRRQCGGAEGLLRRLAYFPPRLVRTGFVAVVRQARMAKHG